MSAHDDHAISTRSEASDRPVAVDQYPLDGAWVVVAAGELDMDTVPALQEALEAGAASHSSVVLDAGAITFADSTALTLLLRMDRSTTFRIAAPGPALLQLMQITGADRVLTVKGTVEEARTA
ncbi:MAG TPA: STAS domain-containing protein [Streptomyces sp.]|uniref:STAS domain-containing protein n=1 Tax=Streptomyces sp. TaxID=1931 RepID=UPI002CE31E95|nr:STAS domain-containing protein [Streptomyces sp.]HWU08196.1 STAS domain-containing protein [Streptomyces sp.]